MRPSERTPDVLRSITLETGVTRYAAIAMLATAIGAGVLGLVIAVVVGALGATETAGVDWLKPWPPMGPPRRARGWVAFGAQATTARAGCRASSCR